MFGVVAVFSLERPLRNGSSRTYPSRFGLVHATNAHGTDQIIEAKGEAYGTNIWTRTYRGSSSYGGVRRTGWSA